MFEDECLSDEAHAPTFRSPFPSQLMAIQCKRNALVTVLSLSLGPSVGCMSGLVVGSFTLLISFS